MLTIDGVSKRYGEKVALQNVSFTVPSGCTYGLLGPNGAGKSTLIRIINKIMMADSGKVFLNGEEITSKHIDSIGYMPEERGLYKKMKVGEHVMYLARLKGLSKTVAMERIKWWFDRMEVSDWWNKKVESLSKGMQQKIQFIATVLHNPKLIILDEPFSGFDPVNAEAVKDELLRLKDEGATIMLSTHRMESVEELCDHVAMIHKSEKVIEGKINEVKRDFGKNIYETVYSGDRMDADLLNTVSHERNEEGLWVLQTKLGETEKSNDILKTVINQRSVVSFREVLPTIQEIFVQIAKS